MPYYAIDGANNKIETLSKEEILTAIENARIGRSLTDYDMAIVSRIREINKNDELRIWIGTQAEYNAIALKENNVLYIISDDNYKEEIIENLESLQSLTDELFNDIENERILREAADQNLNNKIITTKGELNQNIAAEATARATAISNEATARQNADATILSRVMSVEDDISELKGMGSTLLFSGNAGAGTTITLSEAFTNFRQLMFVNAEQGTATVWVGEEAKGSSLTDVCGTLFVNGILGFTEFTVVNSTNAVHIFRKIIQALSATSLKLTASSGINISGGGSVSETAARNIVRIYGINRVAG